MLILWSLASDHLVFNADYGFFLKALSRMATLGKFRWKVPTPTHSTEKTLDNEANHDDGEIFYVLNTVSFHVL